MSEQQTSLRTIFLDALEIEHSEKRAVDASAAFVGHIGEKIDDAHREHEYERGCCKIFLHGRSGPGSS